MSNRPARGFGFSPNILGELKSKQKETGRYVSQHESSEEVETAHQESQESTLPEEDTSPPPPIPKRPNLAPPSLGDSENSNDEVQLYSAAQTTKQTRDPFPQPPPPPPPATVGAASSIPPPPPPPTSASLTPPLPPPAATLTPPPPPMSKSSSINLSSSEISGEETNEVQQDIEQHETFPIPPSDAMDTVVPQPLSEQPNLAPPPPPMSLREGQIEESNLKRTSVPTQPFPVVPANDNIEMDSNTSLTETPKSRGLEPKKDIFEEWDTYFAEGEPYYVNRKTGETTWDKPMALLTEAESEALSGDFVWVKHELLAWIPAKIVSRREDGKLVVSEKPQALGPSTIEVQERRIVGGNEVGPMINSNQALTSLTNDLVQLDEVHEPGIIDLLRRRYVADKIYTNVGDILVAVNPFKPTDLFTPATMHVYAQTGKEAMELPPHPYAVINGAYRAMIDDCKDQSLLISGESGAGKTVTVKVCLEFLSEIAGSDNNIEQRILAANPILEAFGNAKTVRNDNSSRFGKFMEIHFNATGSRQIIGCHTINYLLEKSRVVDQAEGERNFHIFHYLMTEFDRELRKKYLVDVNPTDFNYLPNEHVEPDQHDDGEECLKMHRAFEEMGFSLEERDSMFRIVAAILHLGNLEFEDYESTGSKVKDNCSRHLQAFCELSGTNEEKICKSLTMHVSQQRDGLLTRAFSTKTASDARNALARHLYNRLFEWIVDRINKALMLESEMSARSRSNRNLSSDVQSKSNFIGMLDIFGFEIFENNSFEQLSINFANEKLQQMFNRHTFTLEEQTYLNEGIPFDKIAFHDSQPLLNFLGLHASGQPPIRDGVFQLLDEQTAINGTDEKFLQAVVSRHNDKRSLFSDRCKSRTAFQISHYAGSVEYETSGFVYKNADKLYENIESAMEESSVAMIKQLFSQSKGAEIPGPRRSTKTQASLFMRQLSQLEDRTNSTFPRYIRCVKPNPAKKPNRFDSPICLEQLRFAGVFEAVKIRKLGYPFRKTHASFFSTYRCIAPTSVTPKQWQESKNAGNFKGISQILLGAISNGVISAAKECHFGKSMVLYRADQHRALEIHRLGVLNRSAATIQKLARGMYVRNHLQELRTARERLKKAIETRSLEELTDNITYANTLFFKIKESYDAEAVKAAIKLELSLEPKIAKLDQKTSTLSACFDDETFAELESMCTEMRQYMTRDKRAFTSKPSAAAILERYDNFVAQRRLYQELSLATGQVGQRPNAESVNTIRFILETRPKDPLSTKLLDQINAALSVVSHLEVEASLIQSCQAAFTECHVFKVDGQDNISVSGTKASLSKFKDCVGALKSHGPKSLDAVDALYRVNQTVMLYEAVITAMDQAQHAHDPEWVRVEELLGEAQGFGVTSNELFMVETKQLRLINGELALRAEVDKVVSKLSEGMNAVNDEQLSTSLEQADALHLAQHQDESIRDLFERASNLLKRIRLTRSQLTSSLHAVDELMLYEALSLQADCGWGEEQGMIGYDLVEKAREVYMFVQNLTREARIAVSALELDPTRSIVAGCDEIGLKIPELEPLREFLALPKDRQLLRQRDAAVSLQNYSRAVELSYAHKSILFSSQESMDNFALENFPNLKSPEEFAKRFGLTFSKYKVKMLQFYNPTFGKIHTSLTMIEPTAVGDDGKPLHKTATLLFKNVFGIMGDKQYENVESLVVELVQAGLSSQVLADEIFCQVMKQLTANPSEESEARGWNLMSMLLSSFPPSSQLENYLEDFLRRRMVSKPDVKGCVRTLHCTWLCGPLRNPPTISEVCSRRSPGNMDIWFEGERCHITASKDTLRGPPKLDQTVIDWRQPQDEAQQAFQQGNQQQSTEDDYSAEEHLSQRYARGSQNLEPPPPPPPPKRIGVNNDEASNFGSVPPPPPKKNSVQHTAAHTGVDQHAPPPPPPPPPKRRASIPMEEEDEDDII